MQTIKVACDSVSVPACDGSTVELDAVLTDPTTRYIKIGNLAHERGVLISRQCAIVFARAILDLVGATANERHEVKP